MTAMIATAFGIYRQYNGLDIFHLAAVLTFTSNYSPWNNP